MPAELFMPFVMVLVAALLPLQLLPAMIWAERKVSAFIQDRTGPNRADILGIRLGGVIHSIADVVKLIAKEDMTPSKVNSFYYSLGPFLALFISLIPFSIIPLADTLKIGGAAIPLRAVTLDVGILFILAITSFHVYAVVFAGWASNNSFSLLGGLRSAAQMVSYELGLGLSLVGMIMVAQTLDLNEIVRQQGGTIFGILPAWNVFLQPLGFLIFVVSIFAETNRNPFDLPEGESEIIGFHVEYSSMRFAFFFMGEYIAIIGGSAVVATLFLGGWQVPFFDTEMLRENAMLAARIAFGSTAALCVLLSIILMAYDKKLQALYTDKRRFEARVLLGIVVTLGAGAVGGLLFLPTLSSLGEQIVTAIVQNTFLVGKILLFCFFFIWVRWTLPRFRYDQLMNLGWKTLIPLALLNIFLTGVALVLFDRGA